MRQSPISYSTLSQLLTLYVYIGPKAVGLSYSNIGKFQGKFNTANPQTRNKKPSNNNKKKPLKKPRCEISGFCLLSFGQIERT